jgi:TetR/AcrR family fatty acid metabolism transcriptional regulator
MPRVVNKEEKKMEILHSAMKVFAQKGVVKTKMIDIAMEAGIGKGTIYEYFKSKEEIFINSFEYFFHSMGSRIAEVVEEEGDPVKQLRQIAEISLNSVLDESGDYVDIMMDFWAEGVRNKNQEFLNKVNLKGVYAEFRSHIKRIIQMGIGQGIFRKVDPKTAASVFIGLFDGIMLQWIVDRRAIDLKKVIDFLTDDFINGIKA